MSGSLLPTLCRQPVVVDWSCDLATVLAFCARAGYLLSQIELRRNHPRMEYRQGTTYYWVQVIVRNVTLQNTECLVECDTLAGRFRATRNRNRCETLRSSARHGHPCWVLVAVHEAPEDSYGKQVHRHILRVEYAPARRRKQAARRRK